MAIKMGESSITKLIMGEIEADKAYMGEILVYEKESSGSETWVFNEKISITAYDANIYNINFTSNNKSFSQFTILYSGADETAIKYDSTLAFYGTMGWLPTEYFTVTFETAPTGELLTWLQANAVKQ